MRKLNIIHICDKFGVRGSNIHGVSRLFAWWFPRFDSEKFNVKLYAVKHPDSPSRTLEADGVNMTYLGRSALDPRTLTTFLSVIKREKADLIHLHGWIAANFGRVAGRLAGIPTIMHEHGVDPSFPVSQRIADKLLSPFNHLVVGVSKSVREFIIANRSVPPWKVRIVYNGAPLDEFSPADPKLVAQVRDEFGIPAGCRVIGTIGRLDTQKGITYFLQAAKRLVSDDIRFLVVGDGPKRQELEDEAMDLGLGSNVIFAGHRSDIPAVQSLLDVQVFPSLWEGTPLTVFEALAMGKAIVSTNVDGLGEVLVDGECALVVEPANPDQLADGVQRVLSDSTLSDQLRAGALTQSKKFDISQTVRNLESLYEELCVR